MWEEMQNLDDAERLWAYDIPECDDIDDSYNPRRQHCIECGEWYDIEEMSDDRRCVNCYVEVHKVVADNKVDITDRTIELKKGV